MDVPNALTRAMNDGRLLVLWGHLAFSLAERPPANRVRILDQWAAGAAEERPHPELVGGLPLLPPLPVLSLDPGDRVERAFAEAGVPLQIVRSRHDVPGRNRHSLLKLGGDLTARRGVALSRAEVREVHSDRDKRYLLDEARRVAMGGAVLLLGCDPANGDFRAWWAVLAPALRGAALYALGEPATPWPQGITCLELELEEVSGALRAARAPAPSPVLPAAPEPELPFDDVEIHVGVGSDGSYPVTIQTSQAGEASDTLDLLLPDERLRGWLAQLEGGQTNRDALVEMGQSLFQALFHDAVRDRYIEAVGRSRAGLRLRLWFEEPKLQALPWELLYDDQRGKFLALMGNVRVTRYLSVPERAVPLVVEPPLRVLVATASPRDQPHLDVEADATALEEALAAWVQGGSVRLTVLHHARAETLERALGDHQPHVLHFAGHGSAGQDGGVLLLEDQDGDAARLPGSELATLLTWTNVRLAVLNACLSSRDAAVGDDLTADRRRAMLGVGPALVKAGLGAVVANQFTMGDVAARQFAGAFYTDLARFEPVDRAVSRARLALMLAYGEGAREWATPVLFLRAPDGMIFARPQ